MEVPTAIVSVSVILPITSKRIAVYVHKQQPLWFYRKLPDFSQVQHEIGEDGVAGDLLRRVQLLDRGLRTVDVDPLLLWVYEPPQPRSAIEVLPHLVLQDAQPVGGRAQLDDEI